MNIAITIFLSVFFLFASSIKILAWQKFIFDTQLKFFQKYGLNRSIMFLVGMVEFSGAVLLVLPLVTGLVPLWSTLGALLITGTSVGAIFFHFRFDTWKDALPAILTLVLSSYLWGQYALSVI